MKSRCVSAPRLIALGVFPATSVAAGQTDPARVLRQRGGAWRLITVETIRPGEQAIYPFYGRQPGRLLVYDANGWMTVAIVSDPRPTQTLASSQENFKTATPAKRAGAFDGFYACYRT